MIRLGVAILLLCLGGGSAQAQAEAERSELTMVYLGASWMQRAAYLFSLRGGLV